MINITQILIPYIIFQTPVVNLKWKVNRIKNYQCPGQFIGFRAYVSFSTSNENILSCKKKETEKLNTINIFNIIKY